MKISFLTNSISPHQIPFAEALVERIGAENYTYIYTNNDKLSVERKKLGWDDNIEYSWCVKGDESHPCLMDADVVMSGVRALGLFEKRIKSKKKTIYMSERWFKPPIGFFRVLVPSYFKMARRFVKFLADPNMLLMPIGIHAVRDMVRLINFMEGNICSLFCSPKLAFESRPGGLIVPLKDAIKANLLSKEEIKFANRYGFVQIPKRHWNKVKPQGIYSKMRLWGYFVKSSSHSSASEKINNKPTALWVGRMLGWKKVNDLIKASSSEIALSLYGKGSEENNLKLIAKGKTNIYFNDSVPISEVRELMKKHDVYVLSSNAYEGWGAVVSEALEEGMKVVGTVDAGSTATMLPPTHLYKAGGVKRLRKLLSQPIKRVPIGEWSAVKAAEALEKILNIYNC